MNSENLIILFPENVNKSTKEETENGTNRNNLIKGNENAESDRGQSQTHIEGVSDRELQGHIERQVPKQRIWHRMFTSCITLHRGWRIYKNYDVAFAGLSLASLYFTVLAFHYITTGE